MKQFLAIFSVILFIGCNLPPQRPDYTKDGKEYSIREKCVKSHDENVYEYHWGYNVWKGKYEWHWGWNTNTVCDSSVLDTTEINLELKYYKR